MTPEAKREREAKWRTRHDYRAPWQENPYAKPGLAALWHRLRGDHMESDT